jgi:hypothetical protein
MYFSSITSPAPVNVCNDLQCSRIVGSVELFCSDCHLVCTFPPSLLVPENIFSEKLIFLKRRAGYQGTSVIGIECFSVWFWLCLVVLFIILTIATLLQAWRLCRLNTIKERVGYPFVVPPSLFPPLLPHSHYVALPYNYFLFFK